MQRQCAPHGNGRPDYNRTAGASASRSVNGSVVAISIIPNGGKGPRDVGSPAGERGVPGAGTALSGAVARPIERGGVEGVAGQGQEQERGGEEFVFHNLILGGG